MNTASVISHEATVRSVDRESVTVTLSQSVSCTGCHAEKSCGMSGNTSMLIKVDGSYDLKPGERVELSIKGSQGYMALFLGYLLPLTLVVTTLIILSLLHTGELVSGLASFGILIPYYIILWIFRRYVGKKFSITIKTAN